MIAPTGHAVMLLAAVRAEADAGHRSLCSLAELLLQRHDILFARCALPPPPSASPGSARASW